MARLIAKPALPHKRSDERNEAALGLRTFMNHAVPSKADPPGCDFGDGPWVKGILDGKDTARETIGRIIRANGNSRLRDDGSGIQFRHHEVDRAAVKLHAILKGPLMRMQPTIGRQKRGMNVEEATFPMPDEMRRQNAHESCEHDEFDAMGAERLLQFIFKRFACGKELVINGDRGNAVARRRLKSFRVWAIGNDAGNLGRIISALRSGNNRRHV